MNTELMLSEAWDKEAEKWIEWARRPGHDCFWQYHRDQFLEIVPEPGSLTVDIGCGEGRLTRHLRAMGHKIRAFDASKTMIEAARQADPEGSYEIANAERLPLADLSCDLAVVFMVLQDVDDLPSAVAEMSRILSPGGRACIAIVHPLNSAGTFNEQTADSEFVIKGSYLESFRYSDSLTRDGIAMTFHSMHRSVEHYSREFERANLMIEAIREHPVPSSKTMEAPEYRRWQRLPLFMHFRLVRSKSG